MSEWVIGFSSYYGDDWWEVCRVEAPGKDAPVTRIISVTDEAMASPLIERRAKHPDAGLFELTLRVGMRASLAEVMPDGSLRGWDEPQETDDVLAQDDDVSLSPQ